MEERIWKNINGYDGYLISQFGEVKSPKGKIRKDKQSFGNASKLIPGYRVIRIKLSDTNISIHRLVAIAFIPNPNNLPQVNHIDGNKSNNYYKNLEWSTHSQNCIHAVQTRLKKVTFDPSQVIAIRDAFSKGYQTKIIANYFKVMPGTISNITRNFSWKHLNIK